MSTESATVESPPVIASFSPAASSAASGPSPKRSANPLDLAPAEFKQALARRSENRRALIEWVRGSLVDGVDFGAVPLRRGGFSKPSLRKPGAEKICGMLGVTASFPTLKDYEAAALDSRELEQVILRCHLLSADGQIVADGVGARSLRQDHGDVNKAMKMAIKSAMIDATLRMAGLSEIFTQDLEDMPQDTFEGDASIPHGPLSGSGSGSAGASVPREPRTERLATERQVKLIRVRLDQAGISEEEFLEKFDISELATLPFSKVNPALHWISGVAA